MKSWEKASFNLPIAEAYVAVDALRCKGQNGLFTSQSRLEKHPNRYERVAESLENQIPESLEDEGVAAVTLGPVERYLCRRAIEWTQQFRDFTMDAMRENGFNQDIKLDEIEIIDEVTGKKSKQVHISLRAGSRPHNMVFLSSKTLESIGVAQEQPVEQHSQTTYESLEADESMGASA